MTTITAAEMREALGLSPKSIGTFNKAYRDKYPHAFVVVKEGKAGWGGHATLYDRQAFLRWLKARKAYLGK